jgi:hypothetical protein
MTKRDNLRTAIYLKDIGHKGLLWYHLLLCVGMGDTGAVKMCDAILGRWEELQKKC